MYVKQSSLSRNSPISAPLSVFRNNPQLLFEYLHDTQQIEDPPPPFFFKTKVNQTSLFLAVNNSIINYVSYIQYL